MKKILSIIGLPLAFVSTSKCLPPDFQTINAQVSNLRTQIENFMQSVDYSLEKIYQLSINPSPEYKDLKETIDSIPCYIVCVTCLETTEDNDSLWTQFNQIFPRTLREKIVEKCALEIRNHLKSIVENYRTLHRQLMNPRTHTASEWFDPTNRFCELEGEQFTKEVDAYIRQLQQIPKEIVHFALFDNNRTPSAFWEEIKYKLPPHLKIALTELAS